MSEAEVRALRREVANLREEQEICARLASFDGGAQGRERTYRFIASEQAHFTLSALCRATRVSRSAYYAWAARQGAPSEAVIDEAYFADEVYDIWTASKCRYGSPRVSAELARRGRPANDKRVAATMAGLGIAGACGRRKARTTVRDPKAVPAPDLVERDFSASGPDELYVTDVTYVPTDEGWLYVCSVLDVFTRVIVGWSIAGHLRTELCSHALVATARRRDVRGAVLHSDHGCQYTSHDFSNLCKQLGVTQSMGSVGDSYDNAMAESLWSSLKRELVEQYHFSTKQEARQLVFEWIVWYNNQRLHSALGYLPPAEFEESYRNRKAA